MRFAPQETRTYLVTAVTAERRSLFQVTSTAELFVQCLLDYRRQGKFLLHAYVIMPEHFHALITPRKFLWKKPCSSSRAGSRSS
jgi:putative transposase